MKRTIRKIAIVLSMGMMLVLLTSRYSYALQLPSGLAVGIVINPNNQQQIPPEDNGNVPKESGSTSDTTDSAIKDTTVDMLRQKKDKALSDTSMDTPDIDREKIQQEIDESINSIDENALQDFNSKFSNNSGSERLKHVSTAANELIDSWDPKTGVDTLESSLQELANREGVTIDIEDDNIIISYVLEGETYTTSIDIKETNFIKAPYNSCFHQFSNGVCTICGKACENSFHTDVCPKCGLRHDGTTGYGGFSVVIGCINLFHNYACPDCGMQDRYSFIFNSGSVISQGHPEIVFGIGGLVIGFFAAMLVFRKKNSTLSSAENKGSECVENNDTAE